MRPRFDTTTARGSIATTRAPSGSASPRCTSNSAPPFIRSVANARLPTPSIAVTANCPAGAPPPSARASCAARSMTCCWVSSFFNCACSSTVSLCSCVSRAAVAPPSSDGAGPAARAAPAKSATPSAHIKRTRLFRIEHSFEGPLIVLVSDALDAQPRHVDRAHELRRRDAAEIRVQPVRAPRGRSGQGGRLLREIRERRARPLFGKQPLQFSGRVEPLETREKLCPDNRIVGERRIVRRRRGERHVERRALAVGIERRAGFHHEQVAHVRAVARPRVVRGARRALVAFEPPAARREPPEAHRARARERERVGQRRPRRRDGAASRLPRGELRAHALERRLALLGLDLRAMMPVRERAAEHDARRRRGDQRGARRQTPLDGPERPPALGARPAAAARQQIVEPLRLKILEALPLELRLADHDVPAAPRVIGMQPLERLLAAADPVAVRHERVVAHREVRPAPVG
ncbi:hypothetical protein BURPS1710b_A0655 [Burkholderia pseudomallei 1710b]|uniref:Uncharacterized protein n=1 Tax=Burkholderia pseudomallei (strain 1710b) TaxID=320372 RepID=Q3JKT9_BURP1|nr:hypothetical protein BURPS1710b_A0655 [Burkholderia pseudomallei 1710b]